MESKQYHLNEADVLKILKGAGIAVGGAILTYLAQVVTKVDFGTYTPIVVALAGIAINTGKKFLEGE